MNDRELKARRFTCDACGSAAGEACVTMRRRPGSRRSKGYKLAYSHENRYGKLSREESGGRFVTVWVPDRKDKQQ